MEEVNKSTNRSKIQEAAKIQTKLRFIRGKQFKKEEYLEVGNIDNEIQEATKIETNKLRFIRGKQFTEMSLGHLKADFS